MQDLTISLITGIVLTADKSKLVTTSYDKSIVVLEKETLKLLSRVPSAHTDVINTVAADPFNANSIVTAGNDGKVLTWDVRKTNIEGNVSQSCKPIFTFISYIHSRTATGIDGTLHTDFRKSETSRDIKKKF
jgi:WD40 repeat protein